MSHLPTHGPHVFTGLAAGLPFSANILTKHERGGTYTGFLARDSRGRVHRRIDLAPGLTITGITDPVAEKTYTVNSPAGAVIETPYTPPNNRFGSRRSGSGRRRSV